MITLFMSFFSITNYSPQNFTKKQNHTTNKKKHYNINCKEYEYFSWQLNDSVHHYLEKSYLSGIKKTLKHPYEIDTFVKIGSLTPIQNTNLYIVDTLKYSYPFLIPDAKQLLHEIATSFQEKLLNTNLKGTRLVITSILRTSTTIKKLRRRNRNAIRYSAHLHGTTFDITYDSFDHEKKLSTAENESLRDILAKTLFELRSKKKCWVTYERYQTCFHIVNRIHT